MAANHSASDAPEPVVQAPGPSGPLRGLLHRGRRADARLALIIPGSGPTDCDGNNPLGVDGAPYKQLAEELARLGISAARVDKRGMFSSAQAVTDANDVTMHDYAADVLTWVRELRRETGAACIWVIGHSEGGLVALLADTDDPGICGAILLSSPGRRLGVVLREQLRANPANGPFFATAMQIVGELEAGRHVSSEIPPELLPLFHPRVQKFLVSAMAVDPVRVIAGYGKPVLVLQGQRDLQVTVEDARLLSRAGPTAELVIVPDANHVLKHVTSDDREANLSAYADPCRPISAGVASAIANFIARHAHP